MESDYFKLPQTNSIRTSKGKGGIISLFVISLILINFTSGCATDDLGLCTISTSGDDLVYEEITIEECQNIFGDTAGARGWSWDPQD